MTLLLGIKLSQLKTKRSGVIVYTIFNDKIHLLLAQDSNFNEFGDFGGGVRKTECSLSGGLREFRQESREIFEKNIYCANNCTVNIALANGDMAILFVKVDPKWYELAPTLFEEKKNQKSPKCYNEISQVKWVTQEEFIHLLYSNNVDIILWSKIKNFFKQNLRPGFWTLLKSI